jgi:tetratricopeptide (TPR) repeat protein
LYNWAATLQDAGDDAAAEPVLRELLALVDANGLGDERFVPAGRNALAKVLEKRGEHAEADKLFRAALEERRRRFPTPNVELAYSLSDYGEALVDRGDAQAALPMIEELLELRAKLRNDGPWLLPWTRRLHARCLTKLGRFAEAEAELLAARKEVAALKELYEAWDVAEPGKGIAERAGDWQ